jgi:hypothetical protein
MTKQEFLDSIAALYEQALGAAKDVMATPLIHGDKYEIGERRLAANKRAAEVFSAGLPMMASRRDAQLYIATVTYGFAKKCISGEDLKRHLYAAQLALAAFSGQPESPEPRPARAKKGWAQ